MSRLSSLVTVLVGPRCLKVLLGAVLFCGLMAPGAARANYHLWFSMSGTQMGPYGPYSTSDANALISRLRGAGWVFTGWKHSNGQCAGVGCRSGGNTGGNNNNNGGCGSGRSLCGRYCIPSHWSYFEMTINGRFRRYYSFRDACDVLRQSKNNGWNVASVRGR